MDAVSKIGKNIYRSEVRITFEPNGHVRYSQGLYSFIKYCLTQWISKLPGSFEIR